MVHNMARKKCTCLEVFGEDPNCAKHGEDVARKHPDYERGYADAFSGRDDLPGQSWFYYEGYIAAADLRKAITNVGAVILNT